MRLEDERKAPRGSRGMVFLQALRAALGRYPLWLSTWAVGLLLALVPAVPWSQWFAASTQHAYAPGEVLASLPETFRHDHEHAMDRLGSTSASVSAVLAFVMMLVGVFCGGGWLQVFRERTHGRDMRRFLWGGAKYFGRFLRVWLLTLLVLSLLSWTLFGWPWEMLVKLLVGSPARDLEVARSEWTAVGFEWFQAGAFALGFALVMAWGDYTRTRMALHESRSALWAGLCTFFLLVAHPVRALRPMAVLLLVEVGVVAALARWSWGLNTHLGPDSGWGLLVQLFLIGQAALMWQSISRAARYSVAMQVSHELVPPLTQPDPWASRIGGPGGPQYPVDDTDDYNVSI